MPLFRCEGQHWGSRLEQLALRDSHEKAKACNSSPICQSSHIVSTIAKLGLPVAVGRAEGRVSRGYHHCRFPFFFRLPPLSSPLYLVAGAASAQAQKRVRLSDVGHTEHEGLPVPVSAPVPGPAAGVGQSAAVVAALVGHSSPLSTALSRSSMIQAQLPH